MRGKILIIEDDRELLKLLAQRVREEGYEVETAADGHVGLEMAKLNAPDLVISDLAIPKLSGSMVVRILKQSPKHRRIPIVMLSAFVSPEMHDGVEIPADFYMSKPFQEGALMKKIEELIEKNRPQVLA